MFPLLFVAAIMMGAAAAGRKRKAKMTVPPQPVPQPQPEEEKHDITNQWAPFPDLKAMQQGLDVLGFDVGPKGPDGRWGSDTQGALSDFQIHVNDVYEMNLREDGEPDAPTRTAVGVGLDLLAVDQWTFPGEEPEEYEEEGEVEEYVPEEYVPEEGGQWEPEDWDEVTWSDKLFVAPDCSRVVKGMFWTSQRLNPQIIAAAKEGGTVFAEDIMDAELAKDSPFCIDAGYDNWGPEMQEWYDTWVDLIYQDLELYAEFPELIGEY